MSRISLHIAPPKQEIENNKRLESEGERIRAALERFLKRYKIVSIELDAEKHVVQVQSVKLPAKIKPVLTIWGSIFVRDERLVKSCPDLKKRHQCPNDCYPLREKKEKENAS